MPDQVELKVSVQTDGASRLDQLLQSVQNIEKALTAAANPLKRVEDGIRQIGQESENQSEKIKAFGEALQRYIETPGKTAAQSVRSLLETMGPLGVGIAAATGVFSALGTAAFESAKSLGELGTQINNVAIRTGLSTVEVGQFSYAAKLAGSDITSLEGGMRILSRALADNSDEGKRAKDALHAVGIAANDVFGNATPTSALLLQMSDAMGKMSTMAERNTFAMNVMGRAGLELVPMILQLRDGLRNASNAEVFSQKQVDDMEEMDKRVQASIESWKKLGHAIEGAAATYFTRGTELGTAAFYGDRQGFVIDPSTGKYVNDPVASSASGAFARNALPSTPAGRAVAASLQGVMDSIYAPLISAGSNRIAGAETQRAIGGKTGVEANLKAAEKAESDAFAELEARKGSVDSVVRPLAEAWEKTAAALAKARAAMDDFNLSQENLKKATQDTQALHLLNTGADVSTLTGPDKLEAERADELAKFSASAAAVPGTTQSQALLAEIAIRAGRNTSDVALARGKQGQEAADRIQRIKDQIQQDATGEGLRHIGRMAALLPDANPNQLAYDTRVGIAGQQADYSSAQAEAQFARDNEAATTKQQHDEAAQKRLEAYWEAARKFQEEYSAATDELTEKNAEDDKRHLDAVEKLKDDLAAIAQHSVTDNLVRQFQHTDKLAQLTSGPGQEGAAVSTSYQSRLAIAQAIRNEEEQAAQEQYDRDAAHAAMTNHMDEVEAQRDKALAEAKKKYDDEIYDAREERELKLLDMQMKSLDSFRNAAGGVFDALTSKNPGQAMQQFFLGKVRDLGRGVFENLSEPVFHSVQGSLTLPGQIGSDGKSLSPLGQILKGTVLAGTTQQQIAAGVPGASSPDAALRKANTDALMMQTKATVDLTQALTYIASGGTSGSLPNGASVPTATGSGNFGGLGGAIPGLANIPGLGTFASDLNGITGQGSILSPSSTNPIAQLARIFKLGSGGGGTTLSFPWSAGASSAPVTLDDLNHLPVLSNGTAMAKTGLAASLQSFSGGLGAFGQGAASVAKGQGVHTLFGNGSDATKAGAAVGLAAATYEGVSTAIKDFNKGGARGAIGGIGAIAGTAAAFDPEPISHSILEGVALASKVITSLFGDPKAARQASINHELTNNAYNSTGYIDQHGNFVPGAQPRSISYFGASNGESFDTNFMGGIRGGAYASTTRNTYDPSAAANQLRNGTLAPPPGYSFDNAIGFGNNTPNGGPLPQANARNAPSGLTPAAPLVIQVHAMDSKSFLDHASDISAAVRKGVQMGHPLVQELQQTLRPR